MRIGRFHSIELPPEREFRRDNIVPPELQDQDKDSQYDFHTLFYDAFYIPSKRSICIICPKLFNLEKVVKDGTFSAAGETLRIATTWHFKRYSQIWLRCSRKPQSLRFRHTSFDQTISLAHEQWDLFRGLNCAVTKSKDNDLHWIRDWAEFHVRVHGLQGIVFFDNSSSKYEPADILDTFQKVSGLQRVEVIPAPFRFGCKHLHETKFLQVGLLNIARLRFCAKAAAVLCTDVDELIKPVPDGGIFAATRRSPLGYLLFRGRWRETAPTINGNAVRHADHVYRKLDDECRATKYCIDPRGVCGFSHWDIHGAVRGFLKNFLTSDKIEYWHCRQISTSWEYDRGHSDGNLLELDAETVRVLGESFQNKMGTLHADAQ